MNKRVLWLRKEKTDQAESAIVEAEQRAVEKREKTVARSWLAAGVSTVAAIGSIAGHDKYPAVGLTICAGFWMTALHISDTMSAREVPRIVRWAIYGFAVVASVILIFSLFHRGP
ncbi:MAG: hypothetical protein JWM41_1011 [Gemmatimonadetes bacterium]|nr:hypothetical protein [Gemmatimonadota bacterium]